LLVGPREARAGIVWPDGCGSAWEGRDRLRGATPGRWRSPRARGGRMGYDETAGRDAGEERPTMTDRVPIFVELCAGTAALSLRLEHPRARPPVSRMGAKTGYADVILRCMGLRPGQGADRYLWCEPDAGVRLLLHAYRDRELATAAADIIRGWQDEDPRALWERLRAEGPAVCPPVDAREVARWAAIQANTQKSGGFDAMTVGGPSNRRPMRMEDLASRNAWSITLPATIADDARAIDPPQLPPGVVVYIDPPYLGTTGYAHTFPREEWVPVVQRWQEAGALVVVSEAEPIPELMADGWHAVRIDGERKGQKRTFSKQQAEWLTMSEAPRWRPSVQMGLWR